MESESQNQPIACNLAVFSATEAAAHEELTRFMMSNAQEVTELADGFTLRFADSLQWTPKLATFVQQERRCCPFFTFELHFAPTLGPVALTIRGPEGAKALIEQAFGALWVR